MSKDDSPLALSTNKHFEICKKYINQLDDPNEFIEYFISKTCKLKNRLKYSILLNEYLISLHDAKKIKIEKESLKKLLEF